MPTETPTPSSLEIAQEAKLRPITEIAAAGGLEPGELDPYGQYKAKVSLSVLDRLGSRPDGKLVCVTAITPTKFGEGGCERGGQRDRGAAGRRGRPLADRGEELIYSKLAEHGGGSRRGGVRVA